jgi:hypothetical protein
MHIDPSSRGKKGPGGHYEISIFETDARPATRSLVALVMEDAQVFSVDQDFKIEAPCGCAGLNGTDTAKPIGV